MKDMKSFYTGTILVAGIVFCLCLIGQKIGNILFNNFDNIAPVTETSMGSFLAAQHALYVNDFDTAEKLLKPVNVNINVVKRTKILTDFLNGKLPDDIDSLKKSKELSDRLIYDVHLIRKNDWKNIYNRHGKDTSVFLIPLRVFSAVNQGKTKEALKYINSLDTHDSWKAFLRGQIAVLNKDIDGAAKEFANVHPDFMNVNDYLYLMSFYKENNMFEDMDILRYDFLSKPGSMYIVDNEEYIPDWSNYDGYANAVAFSIVQNISHTKIMIFTDFSLLMLKFADAITQNANTDAINYYLGQYYFFNTGDYEKSFNAISRQHPLYLFGKMKIAEKTGDLERLKQIAKENPLFLPAVKVVVANEIKNGNKRAALRYINRALRQKNLNDDGRVLFLKHRANIYLLFGSPRKAQRDLDAVKKIDDRMVADFMLLQARTWAAQNKNLSMAYDYAMSLVKRNTSDVTAWDILGVIVEKREGTEEGIEVLERVGEISVSVSSLYEHLGDMYKKQGKKDLAEKAYLRALDLSDDGLVVVPYVEKKLRKLQ